jgi:hypothetical protein
MRQIPRNAALAALMAVAAAGCGAAPATAQNVYLNQKQNGINLPAATLPQGYDEVRTSDGATCHSNVSNSGAYFDTGVIGNGGGADGTSNGDLSAYGRVVIPIGRTPPRLDCTKMYELEVLRLRLQIEALKRGESRTASADGGGDWARTGWSSPPVDSVPPTPGLRGSLGHGPR